MKIIPFLSGHYAWACQDYTLGEGVYDFWDRRATRGLTFRRLWWNCMGHNLKPKKVVMTRFLLKFRLEHKHKFYRRGFICKILQRKHKIYGLNELCTSELVSWPSFSSFETGIKSIWRSLNFNLINLPRKLTFKTVIAPAVCGATGLPQIDCFVSKSHTTTDPSSWPPNEYNNFESHEKQRASIFTYSKKIYIKPIIS